MIEKAFNSLPLLPPSFQKDSKVDLECGHARAALAELKGAVNIIPNPVVLINTIPLLESYSSSRIENIFTTQDKLFRFSALESLADPATKEALRHRTALKQAVDKPITVSLIEEICSRIKNKPMPVRSLPVRIGNGFKTFYVPPNDQQILFKLLDNWVEFLNCSDIDPLIQMAILHYQFEAIHPFLDGNGRTGRILNTLFLIHKKLLDSPVLYLSHYILENRMEYYQLLNRVTKNEDWNDWILYMLEAVKQTAAWTLHHVHSIKKLMDHTEEYLKEKLHAPHYRNLLLEVLFAYPYCRSFNLQNLGIKSPITSRKYLRKLVELNILTEQKEGKELVFRHNKYLELLMDPKHQFKEY